MRKGEEGRLDPSHYLRFSWEMGEWKWEKWRVNPAVSSSISAKGKRGRGGEQQITALEGETRKRCLWSFEFFCGGEGEGGKTASVPREGREEEGQKSSPAMEPWLTRGRGRRQSRSISLAIYD